jgi:hypothetical protein
MRATNTTFTSSSTKYWTLDKIEAKALVPPDSIIWLQPLLYKGYSHFKVKSSKFRDQKGFRVFPHIAEPAPKSNYYEKLLKHALTSI